MTVAAASGSPFPDQSLLTSLSVAPYYSVITCDDLSLSGAIRRRASNLSMESSGFQGRRDRRSCRHRTRLDSLTDGTADSAGIDAIWLSPIYPSSMVDFGCTAADDFTVDRLAARCGLSPGGKKWYQKPFLSPSASRGSLPWRVLLASNTFVSICQRITPSLTTARLCTRRFWLFPTPWLPRHRAYAEDDCSWPHRGGPHPKAVGEGLFELRLKGVESIARVLFCATVGKRIVMRHGFIKKSDKTPSREREIAERRLEEIKRAHS